MGDYSDYMVRAAAADGRVRAFAATSRDLVEKSRQYHNTSPTISAALGRTLTGTVMMGAMMKGSDDRITVRIEGDGPAGRILATADADGHVKGYCANPQVDLPPNSKGKLDVGGAVGKGTLTVIRDEGLKEPYSGQVNLVGGEIAEDLTYYFAVSEQVPSSVALGVLMNHNNTVREAGGFIVQLMPGALDSDIDAIETNLHDLLPVTTLLKQGNTPEDILNLVLKGLNPEFFGRMPISYCCDCSKERFARGIASIKKSDIQEMIDAGEPIETVCQFCGKKYYFTPDELRAMLAEREKSEQEKKEQKKSEPQKSEPQKSESEPDEP
ncbi:MAG: Hsp33 family molecular chaperone HslO [Lachnospiraceae bacterium]|jgi:molecular chaperone Hsp33